MSLKEMTPWRWGGLRRWDQDERPYESFRREMDGLHKEMERLFDDFWKGAGPARFMRGAQEFGEVTPSVDETEDDKAFHIRVELPGMDKEDVELTLSDGVLTIKGEKKREDEEKGKDFYRKERVFGSFRRSLPIPSDVDAGKIDASFKKGVLKIELPKTEEARNKVKRIPVKAA